MTEQELRADAPGPAAATVREERNIIETANQPRVSGRTLFTHIYLIGLVVLALDIVTKQIVYRTLPLGGPSIEVLGDVLRWTYIHNPGAAFGLFTANRYFFIGVSLLSTIVILALVHSSRYRDRWILISFGLILGGAIGNLLDRLWLGVVIDFIDVGIGRHRWPFFNIADSGISVGVVLLALRFLREPKSNETRTETDPNTSMSFAHRTAEFESHPRSSIAGDARIDERPAPSTEP
jgi:signal peptidase II